MPTAFRLFPPFMVFEGDDHVPLAFGYIKTYETDTTTPKDVFGEKALTTNNGSTIALDSAGRLNVDVWGDGAYYAAIFNTAGVQVDAANNIEIPGGAAQTIPIPDPDYFLTGDSINILTALVRQLPDPTGQNDKILVVSGDSYVFIAKPVDGAPGAAGTSNVTQTSTDFSVNDMFVRSGTATGTNVGGRSQSASVTFGTAFTTAPVWIGIQVTNASLSGFGNMPSWAIATSSTTGFTVKFTMGELDDSQSGFDFNGAVTFKYVAIGVDIIT